MNARNAELVRVPLRALRRTGLIWSIALALYIGATAALWPAFKGEAISRMFERLPSDLVKVIGMQNLGSPAGFVGSGDLYGLVFPLLLIVASVAMASGQTAREEDAGRLELFLAQPISRTALFLGRAAAAAVVLAAVAIVMLAVQLASDELAGLSIPASNMAATLLLCALLAALYAGLALAIAGWLPRPSWSLGIPIALGLAGYLIVAFFPLISALAPWRHLSPWDWAFGGDPLLHATALWRYGALAIPALALVATGILGFGRRDVHAG